MKVIVADKISERGVELLKEQRAWKTVQTTKETLHAEIADADALIGVNRRRWTSLVR